MLNVTQRAKIRLKELLERGKPDDPSVGLRLGKTASGALGVFSDRGRADDEIVEHEGVVVLLVGQEIAASMEDRTIDYDERGPDRRLVVT
jgi:Fe-S cluster assembly iron-binding protein IscA